MNIFENGRNVVVDIDGKHQTGIMIEKRVFYMEILVDVMENPPEKEICRAILLDDGKFICIKETCYGNDGPLYAEILFSSMISSDLDECLAIFNKHDHERYFCDDVRFRLYRINVARLHDTENHFH